MAVNINVDLDMKAVEWSKLEERVRKAVSPQLKQIAETTTEYAAEFSPYLTGHNRSSITWDEIDVDHFRVYTTSGYGGYLELLHRTRKRYIRRGFQRAVGEVIPGGLENVV